MVSDQCTLIIYIYSMVKDQSSTPSWPSWLEMADYLGPGPNTHTHAHIVLHCIVQRFTVKASLGAMADVKVGLV